MYINALQSVISIIPFSHMHMMRGALNKTRCAKVPLIVNCMLLYLCCEQRATISVVVVVVVVGVQCSVPASPVREALDRNGGLVSILNGCVCVIFVVYSVSFALMCALHRLCFCLSRNIVHSAAKFLLHHTIRYIGVLVVLEPTRCCVTF